MSGSYSNPQSNSSCFPTSVDRRSSDRVSAPSNSYPYTGNYSQSTTPLFPQISNDWLVREQEQKKQHMEQMEQMQDKTAQLYRQQQAYEAYHNSLSQSVCMPGFSRSSSDNFPAGISPAVQLPTSTSVSSLFPTLPSTPAMSVCATPAPSSTTEVHWGQPAERIPSSTPTPTPTPTPSYNPNPHNNPTPSITPSPEQLFPVIPEIGRVYENEAAKEEEEEDKEEEEEEDKEEEEEEDKELDLLMNSIHMSVSDKDSSKELHESIQLYQINREDLRRLHNQRDEALRKVAQNAETGVEELKEIDARIQVQKAQVDRYMAIYFKHLGM